VRARLCIERDRHWQAEYWISGVRDYAMSLACRARGLSAHVARGVDDLPEAVRATFTPALVRSLDREELLRALGAAIDGLLRETGEVREMATSIAPLLRYLTGLLDV
jgi:hypothetical protein